MRPVLLVEGDVVLRERLYDVLSAHGISVIAVHSGERALAVLKHERPSLVLADVRLIDSPGCALIDCIRSFDADLPILLLGDVHPTTFLIAYHVQKVLPSHVSDEVLIKELDPWLNRPEVVRRERWPGTILVVDDEPKLRTILQEFLRLHGFTVTTAASGEEALEQLKRFAPTVVLLDIKMPGMDGLLTLKKIKAVQPRVIVIVITGLEEEQTMAQALALGAHDYITKPFNFEYLETILLSKILTGHAP